MIVMPRCALHTVYESMMIACGLSADSLCLLIAHTEDFSALIEMFVCRQRERRCITSQSMRPCKDIHCNKQRLTRII